MATTMPEDGRPSTLQMGTIIAGALSSGKLNLSSRNLTTAPLREYLARASSGADNVNFWEVTDLTSLDLSHNRLQVLDDEALTALASLHVLTVSHNPLRNLSPSLSQLGALKCFRASEIMLQSLGDAPFPHSLIELDLSGNALAQLPANFGSCVPSLQILNLQQNQLSQLPVLPQCLVRLNATANCLTHILLSALGSLEILEVAKNRLTDLGDLRQLVSLQSLNARENCLRSIPALPQSARLHTLLLGSNRVVSCEEITHARGLSILDVSSNGLRELPEAICALGNLRTLDARNNSLSNIPAGLGYIACLTRVLLEGNPLRSIRRSSWSQGAEELKRYLRTRGGPHPGLPVEARHAAAADGGGAAAHLSKDIRSGAAAGEISLGKRGLNSVPKGLVESLAAGNIRSLNLSKNQFDVNSLAMILEGVLSAPSSLMALEMLNVSWNRLRRLPASLCSVHCLRILHLAQNGLSQEAVEEIPLDRLAGTLTEVDFSHNHLQIMPRNIYSLSKLQNLNLAYNRMQNICRPDDHWHGLSESLQELNLANNKIVKIPKGLSTNFRALVSLNIDNNEIKQIPPELALSTTLKALRVWGNPQRLIRPSVLEKGTEAVLAALGRRLPESLQEAVQSAALSRLG